MARRAAAMIRSALATLVPPNFCTTRGKGVYSSLATAKGGGVAKAITNKNLSARGVDMPGIRQSSIRSQPAECLILGILLLLLILFVILVFVLLFLSQPEPS